MRPQIPFCPIPGISFGGLAPSAPSSPSTPGLGLSEMITQPDHPFSGGLPLTHDKFRTHRAPLPPPLMVGSINRTRMISTENPHHSYSIRTLNDATRTFKRDAHKSKARLRQVIPHRARTIAWPSVVVSSRPPL